MFVRVQASTPLSAGFSFPLFVPRPMPDWTEQNIPDQSGRVAIVTGANAGIGYETARALAEKGARVVLACRSQERGADAVRRIETLQPSGSVELMLLDLADLDSVRAFAETFLQRHVRLDLLINNAGVMVPPESKTAAGFELQFGVNVVGHFALTGLLMDRINATSDARVVTVSSLAHRNGAIDFGNLRGEKRYSAWREYSQSKLGNLVFAIELQRRLDAARHGTLSVAAHPGITGTDLQRHMGKALAKLTLLVSQSASKGALPILYAAVSPDAKPAGYYGPDGFYEVMGHPQPAEIKPQALHPATADRLWALAEDATGVHYLSASEPTRRAA